MRGSPSCASACGRPSSGSRTTRRPTTSSRRAARWSTSARSPSSTASSCWPAPAAPRPRRATTRSGRSQRSRADPGAIGEAVGSATITALRTQLAEILRREGEINATLGQRHPAVIEIASQARRIRRADRRGGRPHRRRRAQRHGARAGQRGVARRQSGAAEGRLEGTNDASVRLRELERDVQASRSVYEAFLVRTREVSEQERLDTTNIRVIAPPELPESRSFPPRTLILLAAGGMLGGMLGVGSRSSASGAIAARRPQRLRLRLRRTFRRPRPLQRRPLRRQRTMCRPRLPPQHRLCRSLSLRRRIKRRRSRLRSSAPGNLTSRHRRTRQCPRCNRTRRHRCQPRRPRRVPSRRSGSNIRPSTAAETFAGCRSAHRRAMVRAPRSPAFPKPRIMR